MLVETFMDGDPPSKLADLKEKAQVVIFTPVALEGLDLPEFDCLVHISAISDEFTRRQIRGRIRGGEEYYVVFKDTNDEWKLRVDVPEPEGPLRPVEVGEVDEGKGLSGHYLEADGKAFKYPFVIIVDELEMADVKFRRVMRSCYPTRILPSFKVNMRSTSDAPTIADKLVGDTNLKNKALDYYKDLILAIISTSALLITISLSLVTLSYTSNLLGVRLSSKTTIGYSSFFFLLSIIFSTFSYQRMVGVLNEGKNFYSNRLFRGFLIAGWLTYVLGAVSMFIGIHILIYGDVV